MNTRFLALFGALQGGTRRKPTYLNSGALVSWVYAIKVNDRVGSAADISNFGIQDTTYEQYPLDNVLMTVNLTSVVLQDSLISKTFSDSVGISTGINNFVFVDAVKPYPHTDSVSFNATIAVGSVAITDNVKLSTPTDSVLMNVTISSIAFGAP